MNFSMIWKTLIHVVIYYEHCASYKISVFLKYLYTSKYLCIIIISVFSVGGLETMFNSMCSMTSSLQIAEDCLKSTSDADQGQDLGTPFEGVQKFAQTIDSGE